MSNLLKIVDISEKLYKAVVYFEHMPYRQGSRELSLLNLLQKKTRRQFTIICKYICREGPLLLNVSTA